MKNESMNNPDFEKFDRQARQLHARSLASLSPQTLARLRSARHAATQAAPARGHGRRWLTASGLAAALAVAIGLPYFGKSPTPASASQPAVATVAAGDDYADTLTENPDLYLWLESDGQMLAME